MKKILFDKQLVIYVKNVNRKDKKHLCNQVVRCEMSNATTGKKKKC